MMTAYESKQYLRSLLERREVINYIEAHSKEGIKEFLPTLMVVDNITMKHVTDINHLPYQEELPTSILGCANIYYRKEPVIELTSWSCVDNIAAEYIIEHELAHCIQGYCESITDDFHDDVFFGILTILRRTTFFYPFDFIETTDIMTHAQQIATCTPILDMAKKQNEALYFSNQHMYNGDVDKTKYWDKEFEFWRLMIEGAENSYNQLGDENREATYKG